jgi:hypothetical protein
MSPQGPSQSPVKLGLAVWWPAFWTGFPLKLVVFLLLLAMGVHPWEMPGVAFLLLLSIPIDIWAMGVAARTVFLERLRLVPPDGLGLTLWWQNALLNVIYLPLAYFIESSVTAGAKAAVDAIMGLPFLKAIPVAERITLNLVMWGTVSTIVLIILVLVYLSLFGRLVRRQAAKASSAGESYPQLVRTWDLMRVPADLPLMLTVTTATGVFLVLCFWFFLPATTPHPHESYKQETVKKTRDVGPADVLKKTEKTLAQAEGTVAALEAKAEEEAKEKQPADKGKGNGKQKDTDTGKEQGKGKEQEKGKAAEKSSAAQPVAAKAAGQ